MANRTTPLTWTANRGRYGTTHPLEIPDGGCQEAVDVDFWNCSLARKRAPLIAISLTSGPTTALKRLFLYIPASVESAAQLVALETGATVGQNNIKVRAAGVWAAPGEETAADRHFTNATKGTARGLNGKLFLTGADTVKVLSSTGAIRQMGISACAAATVTDTGAGAYAATLRYYKVAFTEQVAGTTMRRAELSPLVSFTPSGAGTAAHVARPAVPLGSPTHWEVYGSADNLTYYLLTTQTSATDIWDDTGAPGSYSGAQPPVVGDNTRPSNWRCVARDGNRLLGWGSYTTSESQSRLWFTPVLGSSNIGDDERVPLNNYLAIGEADGDYATALSDNVDGALYAFKRRHLYRVVPTGDATGPYVWREVSNCIGAVDSTAIVEGEDAIGRPCLYFVSASGVHRIGASGLENLTANVADLFDSTVRPLMYHADRRQVWFSPTSSGSALVYHVENGAWSTFKGAFGSASCACLYAVTPGSTALVPFVGSGTAAFVRYYADAGSSGWRDDSTTEYESYVLTAPRAPFGLLRHIETQDPMVLLHVGDQATIRVTPIRDFSALTSQYGDVSCVAGGGLVLVLQQAENARMGNGSVIAYKVADVTSTLQYAWKASAISVDVLQKEGL